MHLTYVIIQQVDGGQTRGGRHQHRPETRQTSQIILGLCVYMV